LPQAEGYRLPQEAWLEIKRFVRDDLTGQITLHFAEGQIKSWEYNVKQRVLINISQVQLKSA
jgi:hypothetical protein